MHHNLLNALFLDDLIQMFKDKGWKVINAEDAFQDPIFKISPNIIPAGESLIWALAKETGRYDNKLRYPGEDEMYEKRQWINWDFEVPWLALKLLNLKMEHLLFVLP